MLLKPGCLMEEGVFAFREWLPKSDDAYKAAGATLVNRTATTNIILSLWFPVNFMRSISPVRALWVLPGAGHIRVCYQEETLYIPGNLATE